MFVSFFPKPKLFFISAVFWSALMVMFWFGAGVGLVVPAGRLILLGPSFGMIGYVVLAAAMLFAFYRFFRPEPRLLLGVGVVWVALVVFFGIHSGQEWGDIFSAWARSMLGLPAPASPDEPIIGVSVFWSLPFIWFYLYFAGTVGLFYAFWRVYSPHPWQRWSILGSALILFIVYFQVQVSVAVNNWYGPFWDYVQQIMSKSITSTADEFYAQVASFAGLALVGMNVAVFNAFLVSHWIFRWRTAMNNYYMANWGKLRHIEGASQRVQEDTMRFSQIMESLGVSFIDSIMTLIAFMPVLIRLSANITELPIIGAIPHPLVVAAIGWALFGTVSLVIAGIKLPGLQFRNQRVEAAYRKELVYGEDDPNRAEPVTVAELFGNVRRNYFRLYFHYVYFNVVRYTYLQANGIFSLLILGPSIVAGRISLGLMNQISYAFSQVTSSFQFLVTSWSTIVELLSVHKRLRAFEAAIYGEELPDIDQRYLERQMQGEDAATLARP